MTLELALPDYRMFPYERRLAERELSALGVTLVRKTDDHFVVESPADASLLARLTYVSRVGLNGQSYETEIAKFERVHRATRARGQGRQATRYHVHGIHEYKGKFNPQVVRAFANLLGFQPGEWLLDPFCGSGTSLVEGLALGGKAVGIDRSPIAALLSRTKTEVWRAANPQRVDAALRGWLDKSACSIARAEASGALAPKGVNHLDEESLAYLAGWFTPSALAGLSVALAGIREIRSRPARLLAQVAVSSIARRVSLQLPEDLRVRRRPADSTPDPVLPSLQASVANILLGLAELSEFPDRTRDRAFIVENSASDDAAYAILRRRNERLAVVTSPPYATALPYIDTDRLSIVLLGLSSASEVRELERVLYGSREWTTADARLWSERLDAARQDLPQDVVDLCRLVQTSTTNHDGFRRKATPGLLFRYFANMRDSLAALRRAMRPGERAVFIVGQNRTRGGTEQLVIDTPALLGSVAQTVGFAVDELFLLETWPRFGLHHTNGIAGESALLLSAQ